MRCDLKKIIFISLLITGCIGFADSTPKKGKSPKELIPAGYVIFSETKADLNKDGQEDYIYIIKATDKNKIIKDKFNKLVDRNRRGIIIIFKNKNQYELILENKVCFLSENEDGGVYSPPELSIETDKGNLIIYYANGRYGYWKYTFRYQNSDFELIGFDSSGNSGPVVDRVVSINFLTKKKLTHTNVATAEEKENEDAPEKFESEWVKLKISKPIKLKTITDFDELYDDKLLEMAK